MSPASGDFTMQSVLLAVFNFVSIQLMSPASGDPNGSTTFALSRRGFHSINVPSEWGHCQWWLYERWLWNSFHSINVPSEWGPAIALIRKYCLFARFHSINVPSEWGPLVLMKKLWNLFCGFHSINVFENLVSIQLMSPASGDLGDILVLLYLKVSIQLMSPASGDTRQSYLEIKGRI